MQKNYLVFLSIYYCFLLKYKTLLEPHTCFLFWLLVYPQHSRREC